MRILLISLVIFIVSACAAYSPVTTSSVVDDNPKLTFEVKGYDPAELMLMVDGLEYGSLAQYRSDVNSLRIIPGTHSVVIQYKNKTVLEKSQYFGESTTTVIKVVQ